MLAPCCKLHLKDQIAIVKQLLVSDVATYPQIKIYPHGIL
ncbi:hypothetical protein XBKQ1_1730001 [Xenorhabdus bovienii str. kraussei Quebec]|uniref:Uncharacterized protein n=1 Tax=Xenorhabdus bovienii str. kraussei Quebec TaxID=1398203 RepID=A0A077P3C8_XENBV|nr:hypothetical protein XBKQ1_1730001 [Xenorhabdus bovienii str. kraussei Quebec]